MKDQEYEARLRHEYAMTLKEIVRHESEIAKLMKKAEELEKRLNITNYASPPPHLDRDGCVYWDSVLVKENEDES